jgi:hypothetical protein
MSVGNQLLSMDTTDDLGNTAADDLGNVGADDLDELEFSEEEEEEDLEKALGLSTAGVVDEDDW